jgi:hypothetical protein
MIGGQVKDHAHAIDSALGYVFIAEIALDEFDLVRANQILDVGELSAAEVVDDADAGALFDEGVHEIRADERCASGYEYLAILPVHFFLLFIYEV